MGQSFTPIFSLVGFVRLNLYDSDALHNSGATVFINLRSNSISGTILGVSAALFLPDGFFDMTNFLFSAHVAVAPGVTYYLQPMIQSGDNVASYVTDKSYLGGTAFVNGSPASFYNLWFQEGVVVVPEPSPAWLVLLGSGALIFIRRLRRT